MYFSLVRICLMLLSCHLAFPAPFRMPSASSSPLYLQETSAVHVLCVNAPNDGCLLRDDDQFSILVLCVAEESVVVDLDFALLITELDAESDICRKRL